MASKGKALSVISIKGDSGQRERYGVLKGGIDREDVMAFLKTCPRKDFESAFGKMTVASSAVSIETEGDLEARIGNGSVGFAYAAEFDKGELVTRTYNGGVGGPGAIVTSEAVDSIADYILEKDAGKTENTAYAIRIAMEDGVTSPIGVLKPGVTTKQVVEFAKTLPRSDAWDAFDKLIDASSEITGGVEGDFTEFIKSGKCGRACEIDLMAAGNPRVTVVTFNDGKGGLDGIKPDLSIAYADRRHLDSGAYTVLNNNPDKPYPGAMTFDLEAYETGASAGKSVDGPEVPDESLEK